MVKALPELIRFAREAQGLRQAALAGKVGISQASLSQYENGQATLSRKTLLKLARRLNINPAYLSDASVNPFKSSGLIKMFFPEHLLAGMSYSTLEYIVGVNLSVEVTFLVATSRSRKIDRMISRTIIGQFTQAVLVRDRDNNLFLLRRKRKGAYLVGELDLQARLKDTALREGKTIKIDTIRIPRGLSRKIDGLTVEREDFEDLLEGKKGAGTAPPDISMEKFVREVREGGHDAGALLTLLQELRAQGLAVEDLVEMIKDKEK